MFSAAKVLADANPIIVPLSARMLSSKFLQGYNYNIIINRMWLKRKVVHIHMHQLGTEFDFMLEHWIFAAELTILETKAYMARLSFLDEVMVSIFSRM